jgi:hypothetical protein
MPEYSHTKRRATFINSLMSFRAKCISPSPADWAKRRLRVPKGLVLYYAAVPKRERADLGAIPVTTVPRTLLDCVAAHVSPELTEQAVRRARTRGLIDKDETKPLRARTRTA